MNKIITTITILLISINSVFANSINFKKLNNPGYQNQLKAKYDMHEVVENCYINSETGDMLISTKDATIAYIGKEHYLDNAIVHFDNGKLKFTNLDFKKESIPVLKDVIKINVATWADYLLGTDYYYKYVNLYEKAYDEMQEAYEYMEIAKAEGDEESFRLIEKYFYDWEERAEEARTKALEFKEAVEGCEVQLDGAVSAFEALINSRGDLNGK